LPKCIAAPKKRPRPAQRAAELKAHSYHQQNLLKSQKKKTTKSYRARTRRLIKTEDQHNIVLVNKKESSLTADKRLVQNNGKTL
jgi:hypothetical protein